MAHICRFLAPPGAQWIHVEPSNRFKLSHAKLILLRKRYSETWPKESSWSSLILSWSEWFWTPFSRRDRDGESGSCSSQLWKDVRTGRRRTPQTGSQTDALKCCYMCFFSVNYMIYKHISERHTLIAHFFFHLDLSQCNTLFPWYLRDITMICGVRNVLSLVLKCCSVIPARYSKPFHQAQERAVNSRLCSWQV